MKFFMIRYFVDCLHPCTWARSDTGFNFSPVLLVLLSELATKIIVRARYYHPASRKERKSSAHTHLCIGLSFYFGLHPSIIAILAWVDARGARAQYATVTDCRVLIVSAAVIHPHLITVQSVLSDFKPSTFFTFLASNRLTD